MNKTKLSNVIWGKGPPISIQHGKQTESSEKRNAIMSEDKIVNSKSKYALTYFVLFESCQLSGSPQSTPQSSLSSATAPP